VKAHEENGDLGQAYLNEHMAGGTGPYYMERFSPGEYAVLLQHNAYWRGWRENSIHKIIWRKVKESSTRRLLLEKGDIHIANRVVIDDLLALEKNPKIKIAEKPSFATEYLRMNNKMRPFDDIHVRKAMAYAFDYKAVIEKIMHGRASTLSGPMPSGLFAYNDSLAPYETDLDKARELLSEAGYKPGDLEVTYVYLTEVPYSGTIGEVFQQNLQKLGIKMNIQEVSWVTLLGMVKDPKTTPQLFDGASGDAPINDSIDFLTKQFHSKSTGGVSWNQSWYINPRVDELLDKAKREINDKTRAEYLKEVQKIVHEDMPQVFMFRSHTAKPMLKTVMGYKIDALSWGQFNFYDMSIAD
jgi:peptide/nickel transport system substrate-binding protein